MKTRLPNFPALFFIFVRFRSRRLLNSFQASKLFSKKKVAVANDATRDRTRNGLASTKGPGLLLLTLVTTGMVFAFVTLHLAFQSHVEEMHPHGEAAAGYLAVMTTFLYLLLISALCMTVGSRELAKPEWDFEWLITLPLSKRNLILLRILERTFVNPALYLALVPPLVILILKFDLKSPVLLVAIAIYTALIFFLMAVLQTLFDTGLRLQLGSSRLKNLQAVCNLLGIGLLYATLLNAGSNSVPRFITILTEHLHWFLEWTPIALILQGFFLHAGSLRNAMKLCLALFELAGLSFFGYRFVLFQLRNGVGAGSGQKSDRKNSQKNDQRQSAGNADNIGGAIGLPLSSRAPKASSRRKALFGPIVLRELRLLARDHSYLTQTLLVPLMVISLQITSRLEALRGTGNGNTQTPFWSMSGGSHLLSATAFGAASYSLLFSAFQVLNSEGQAIWILFTLPVKLSTLVMKKALNSFSIALSFAVLFFAYALFATVESGDALLSDLGLAFASQFALVVIGVTLFTIIATSLGVLSYKFPTAEPVQRVRPLYAYLYLFFSGIYVSGLYWSTHDVAQIPVPILSVGFSVVVAVALWRRARLALEHIL